MNLSKEYYGLNGPIVVNSSDIPSIAIWLNAGRELGYSTGDPNGFQREGNNIVKRLRQEATTYAHRKLSTLKNVPLKVLQQQIRPTAMGSDPVRTLSILSPLRQQEQH